MHSEAIQESGVFAVSQHTIIWNENDCVGIAPGSRAVLLNIIYDRHVEELSFPSSICFGELRH